MDWVQWLALAGGLTAVVAFVMGRNDLSRSDASSIYVLPTKSVPRESSLRKEALIFTRYRVFNNSELPALWVLVVPFNPRTGRRGRRRRRLWRFRRLDDWLIGGGAGTWGFIPTIAPRSSTEEELSGPTTMDPDESPVLVLLFRDGHGRSWVRWYDGKLSRQGPSLVSLFGARQ